MAFQQDRRYVPAHFVGQGQFQHLERAHWADSGGNWVAPPRNTGGGFVQVRPPVNAGFVQVRQPPNAGFVQVQNPVVRAIAQALNPAARSGPRSVALPSDQSDVAANPAYTGGDISQSPAAPAAILAILKRLGLI